MEMLKSKATVALVVMILGVAFIGGVDKTSFEDNKTSDYNVSVNA